MVVIYICVFIFLYFVRNKGRSIYMYGIRNGRYMPLYRFESK